MTTFVHFLQKVGDIIGLFDKLLVIAGGDGVSKSNKTQEVSNHFDLSLSLPCGDIPPSKANEAPTDLCHSMTGRS